MMERLLEAEVTEDWTIFEEIELICTMTGFRRRFLIHHDPPHRRAVLIICGVVLGGVGTEADTKRA